MNSSHKGPVRRGFDVPLLLAQTCCWINGRVVDDFRRHDVHVMSLYSKSKQQCRLAQRRHDVGPTYIAVWVMHAISYPHRSGLCWEGMIALRRLVLVLLATLVPNILLRHVGLVCVCLASQFLHMWVQPFAKHSCNIVENISLTILSIVSIMNLIKAVYFESGEIPMGIPDQLFLVSRPTDTIYIYIYICIVRCRYNAVNFLTNIHKRHPIARPLGRGMGCLLWILHLVDILSQFL